MSNFKQIIIVNTDRQTKVPSLKEAFTKSGKSIYSGALFWKTGRKKEGSETAEYANMKFFTWDKSIYELFKNNPAKSFLVRAIYILMNILAKNQTQILRVLKFA